MKLIRKPLKKRIVREQSYKLSINANLTHTPIFVISIIIHCIHRSIANKFLICAALEATLNWNVRQACKPTK